MGSKDLTDGSASSRGNKVKGVADKLKGLLGLSKTMTTLDDERFERTPEPQAGFWKGFSKKKETFTLDDFRDLRLEEMPKTETQEQEWVRIEETMDVDRLETDLSDDIHTDDVHVEEKVEPEPVREMTTEVPVQPAPAPVEEPVQERTSENAEYVDFLPPMKDAVRRPAGCRVAKRTPTVELKPRTVFDFDDPIPTEAHIERSYIDVDATTEHVLMKEEVTVEEETTVEAEPMVEETIVASEPIGIQPTVEAEPVIESESAIETAPFAEAAIESEPVIETEVAASEPVVTTILMETVIEDVLNVESEHMVEAEEVAETTVLIPNVTIEIESVAEPVIEHEMTAETEMMDPIASDVPEGMTEATAEETAEPVIELGMPTIVPAVVESDEMTIEATYVPNFILVNDADATGPNEIPVEFESPVEHVFASETDEATVEAVPVVNESEVAEAESDSLETVLPYEVLAAFDSEEFPEVELDIGVTDVDDEYIEIIVDEEDRPVRPTEVKAETVEAEEEIIMGTGVVFDFFSPSQEETESRMTMTFGIEAANIKTQDPVVEMKEENVIYL